jgi:hypothetical protein
MSTNENDSVDSIEMKEQTTPLKFTQKEQLKNRFWLTRIVYLRYLAFIYLVAFFIAFHQNNSLMGENGLTPAVKFIERYRPHFASQQEAFLAHPTIFWYIPPTSQNLQYISLLGASVSFIIVCSGCANMIMMFLCWICYFSIVNVGQTWYSFGWESQLLEVGFLSMFMVPLFDCWNRFPSLTRTPWITIWGNRWLLFRIMLGAGLIKIRGDECWRNLTCMNYHYQTQPVPNPFSVYFHSNPGNCYTPCRVVLCMVRPNFVWQYFPVSVRVVS